MVARNLLVFDSEALLVDSSSPFRPIGSPIINNSSTPNGTIFEFQSGFGRQDVVVDDTGGDPDVFEDDNPGGHSILDGGGIVPIGTAVESESIIFLRALDDFGNQTGPEIRLTVFSKGGDFEDVWGFATDDFLVPGVKYVKTAGSNNGDSDYEDFIPCFARGTLIRMADGSQRRIEDLKAGDMILTRSGALPMRWIGSTTVDATGNMAPVHITKGALGNDTDLTVSPQHRMLIGGPGAQILFSTEAVLVPAIHLIGLEGITRKPLDEIEYFHLMFDRHEIISANGAPTESFFPGDMGLNALDRATRAELLSLFPQLADGNIPTAAPCLKASDAKVMRNYLAN